MATTVEMANATLKMWDQLDALWQATDNEGHRDQIGKQMYELQKVIGRLMSENTQQAGAAYTKAIGDLKKANAKLRSTIETLNKVAETIELAAKAIDAVTKVIV